MEPVKLDKKEFENLIVGVTKNALEEKIRELGLDKVDRKFGMYAPSLVGLKSEDELEKMSKKERVARFVKALYYKDMGALAQVKAQSEGTGSEGGFAVPEEFTADIARIAEDWGLVRKLSRKVPMGSDTRNYPRLATSVSVTFPGENTEGTPSDFVLENVVLNAKTAVGLTVLSNELLADANVNLVNYLAELYGEALAGEEDAQGLVGTGAPFTGIMTATGVNPVVAPTGNSTFALAAANLDNFREMISAVKVTTLGGAVFVMHPEIWGAVQKSKASTGGDYFASAANPILLPNSSTVANMVGGSLWGYPVYLSDKMPALGDTAISTPFVIFGNLNNLWFGDRQSVTMAISDSATIAATNAFAANQSVVRVTERFALAVGLPKAFAKLVTSAT